MRRALVAGRDYPRSYREFVEMFPGDEACAAYLEQLRWSSGFMCPACGATAEPWRQTRGRLVCRDCRHQASVTGGTILDKTRTPLRTWFEAAWHNRRTSRSRGLVFRRLIEQAVATGPVTEAGVTHGYDW